MLAHFGQDIFDILVDVVPNDGVLDVLLHERELVGSNAREDG